MADDTLPDHYGAHYRAFTDAAYGAVRRSAFGQDIGQNSWLTRAELDRFISHLALAEGASLLDVACGSGGPTLYVARTARCRVVGVEVAAEAVAAAHRLAEEAGLAGRATFVEANASASLPFPPASFDAVLCIDALNHLPDRAAVLSDWARLLRRRGRMVFTDPLTVTGALTSAELATRASIGFQLFAPLGENARLLEAAGLNLIAVEDSTAALAEIAQRRHDAREEHDASVRAIEGDAAFGLRQRFFDLVATLARERRLSRYVYVAERP